MKNLMIVVFITLINISCYSQERVDGSIIDFNKKGEIFSNANLYWYDKDKEKWFEKPSAVESHFGTCNFITIEYNNTIFYVLCSKSVEVRYKYPNIEQGRYVADIYKGYIFNTIEYNKIKNFEEAVSDYDEIRTYKLDMEEFRVKVLNNLKGNESHYQKIVMKIKKENENTIRFRFPEEYQSWTTPFEKRYFETSLIEFKKLTSL